MTPIDANAPELLGIARAIQLAVAPVFLLTAIATTFNVLASRLARVVDRARVMEAQLRDPAFTEGAAVRETLRVISVRARLINRAIMLCVVSALLVSLVVVSLFVSSLLRIEVALPVAITFIVAMLSLAAALIYFLREIFIATAALRFNLVGAGTGGNKR
jgi:Protein of unknown function (DUF2721)